MEQRHVVRFEDAPGEVVAHVASRRWARRGWYPGVADAGDDEIIVFPDARPGWPDEWPPED